MLADDVFIETVDYLSNRELIKNLDFFYQDRLNLQRGMQTHQIRYYTTLIASELIYKSINDYLSNSLKSFPQGKRGRYYSFMPLELKKIVNKRFNKFCKVL